MSASRPSYVERFGRLSVTEVATIAVLAARGYRAGKIAQRLRRHPATIHQHMSTRGMHVPAYGRPPYLRAGRLVKPFTPSEDDRITELRLTCATATQIARIVSAEFGHTRTPQTIALRLRQIASMDEARMENA